MTIRSKIVSQFSRPTGLLGHLAGYIMANRGSNIERNNWTVDLLKIAPSDCVLEIGCGPGIGLKAAAAGLKSGQITGIDHSAAMLAQSNRRMRKEIERGCCLLQLGGLELLADSSKLYDRIYSANVVQFFPNKELAFKNIYGCLADGGIVASTYQPRHKNPTRRDAFKMADDVSEAMESVGFTDIEIHELPIEPIPAVSVTGIKN
jgi:cyclopropane fatty-acyl-phospholipid synthase-like methyltransferase